MARHTRAGEFRANWLRPARATMHSPLSYFHPESPFNFGQSLGAWTDQHAASRCSARLWVVPPRVSLCPRATLTPTPSRVVGELGSPTKSEPKATRVHRDAMAPICPRAATRTPHRRNQGEERRGECSSHSPAVDIETTRSAQCTHGGWAVPCRLFFLLSSVVPTARAELADSHVKSRLGSIIGPLI